MRYDIPHLLQRESNVGFWSWEQNERGQHQSEETDWLTDSIDPIDRGMQAPEIQQMYSVPYPISTIRTRIRQEFERNRFVNKLSVVDVLLLKANADYQVSAPFFPLVGPGCVRHSVHGERRVFSTGWESGAG